MDRQLTKEEFRCLRFQLPLNAQCFYLYLLEQLIPKWASCLNVSLTLSSTYFIWLFTLWFDNTRQMTLRTDTSSDFASRTICWTLIIFVSFHGTQIRKGACPLFHWAIAHHTLYCTHSMPWSTELVAWSGKQIWIIMMFSNANWFRGTQREYSLKLLKHSIVKRILVFKR